MIPKISCLSRVGLWNDGSNYLILVSHWEQELKNCFGRILKNILYPLGQSSGGIWQPLAGWILPWIQAGEFGLWQELWTHSLCCSRTNLPQLLRRGWKFCLCGHFLRVLHKIPLWHRQGHPLEQAGVQGCWLELNPRGKAAPAGGFSQKSHLPPWLTLAFWNQKKQSEAPQVPLTHRPTHS